MLAKWILCSFLFIQSPLIIAQDLSDSCTQDKEECTKHKIDLKKIIAENRPSLTEELFISRYIEFMPILVFAIFLGLID